MIGVRRVSFAVLTTLAAIVAAPQALSQSCTPSWDNGFASSSTGLSHAGLALEVFDDGTGAALYVGGGFEAIAGMPARSIARWDGTNWSPLIGPGGGGLSGGAGFSSAVDALAVFDDGSGPALYAGGGFTHADGIPVNGIAKWDGTSWSALGPGTGNVSAMAVIDDGSGPALYVTGAFQSVGGQAMHGVAKWDGASWSPVSSESSWYFGSINTVGSYDDGAGNSVYVGGMFNFTDPQSGEVEYCFAERTGAGWSVVGSGIGEGTTPNTFPTVFTMATHNDGSGEALYIGGDFRQSAGHPFDSIARWDGSSWSSVGGGLNRSVWTIERYNDGNGPELAVAASASQQAGVAMWSGTGYTYLSTPDSFNGVIRDLRSFDDGSGKALFATGFFTQVDGTTVNHIAKWQDGEWKPVGSGLLGTVTSLATYDDGQGGALYIGGNIASVAGLAAGNIARWDGAQWSPLGTGVDQIVWSMSVFDDGSGEALYVGGNFTEAGGVPVSGVARWDGSGWSAVGVGVNGTPWTMATFDDGTGEALYAAGSFLTSGSNQVNRIAKWNGSSWSPLGTGVDSPVFGLVEYDDGSGSALYAAGQFSSAGGVPANRVARWDGSSWSALGVGATGTVWTIAAFDDGSGDALYIAGDFVEAGGQTVNSIARWDGFSWSPVGPPGVGANDSIFELTVFDDGSGPALYAAGDFTQIGGISADRIARWDGSNWSAVSAGVDDGILAMTEFDDGTGPAPSLFVGGGFSEFDGQPSGPLTKLQGCPPPDCTGDTNGDGAVDLADLNAVLAAFGTSVGDPGFDPDADTNGDNAVDLADLNAVLAAFGTSCN